MLPDAPFGAHVLSRIKKNFHVGIGNTFVPISRPSITTPPDFPISRWRATIHSRTA